MEEVKKIQGVPKFVDEVVHKPNSVIELIPAPTSTSDEIEPPILPIPKSNPICALAETPTLASDSKYKLVLRQELNSSE